MVLAASLFAIIYNDSDVYKWPFSGPIREDALKIGSGLDVTSLVILGNMPQVILSFNYIFLNRLLTSMAATREWSLFAHQRKGLRTSNTTGAQRSTYWLQLPFRFSAPLIESSTILHYLAPQSLFFGSIRYFSPYEKNGVRLLLQNYTALGYSQNAAQVLMIALLFTNTVVILWGRSKNNPGIPQGGLSSALISAACHPPQEDEDVQLKPVQWGEVIQDGDSHEIGHCSFSSQVVIMPVEGREYM